MSKFQKGGKQHSDPVVDDEDDSVSSELATVDSMDEFSWNLIGSVEHEDAGEFVSVNFPTFSPKSSIPDGFYQKTGLKVFPLLPNKMMSATYLYSEEKLSERFVNKDDKYNYDQESGKRISRLHVFEDNTPERNIFGVWGSAGIDVFCNRIREGAKVRFAYTNTEVDPKTGQKKHKWDFQVSRGEFRRIQAEKIAARLAAKNQLVGHADNALIEEVHQQLEAPRA